MLLACSLKCAINKGRQGLWWLLLTTSQEIGSYMDLPSANFTTIYILHFIWDHLTPTSLWACGHGVFRNSQHRHVGGIEWRWWGRPRSLECPSSSSQRTCQSPTHTTRQRERESQPQQWVVLQWNLSIWTLQTSVSSTSFLVPNYYFAV